MTTKGILSARRRTPRPVSASSTSPAIISAKKRFESGLIRIARSRRFEIPEELLRAAKADKLALLIGSGISKQANEQAFPTWQQLLLELNSEAKRIAAISPEQFSEIAQMIRSGEYLMTGQILKESLSRTHLHTFLENKFKPLGVSHSTLHRNLFELHPAVVLTTNYDTLIEDTFTAMTGSRGMTYTYEQSIEAHRYLSQWMPNTPPLIFKLHGCITQPSSAIFSEFDYRKLIYRRPSYRTLLSAIFVNYTVLILGYSLSDREIGLTLETLQDSFDYAKKADYIFLSVKGRSTLDAKKLSSSFGVQPIWYRPSYKHREVLYFVNQFLKALKNK